MCIDGEYKEKFVSKEEAVKIVKDGDIVYVGTSSTIAYKLLEALYARKDELHDVCISSGVMTRVLPMYQETDGPFHFMTYFAGPAEREALKLGKCEYTSLHIHTVRQWCEHFMKDGVAFLEVSAPDEEGYVCYGAYGISMHGHVRDVCSRVVVQINKNQPYIYGTGNRMHLSEADYIVEADDHVEEVHDLPLTNTLKNISSYIVDQIPDGATIQLGLGGISGAVGYGLQNKCDLGVHSEMFTNSMKHLMETGVITNKKKNYMPGKSVASFAYGPTSLYNWLDRNPDVWFGPYDVVNDPSEIAKNDNLISVNTAMMIDLYGQVAADNMAGNQISGIGGQVDFVRGAQLSKGGKSFIALESLYHSKSGPKSRIAAVLPPGTAVTTSRQDVQYVVTEYGCVNLKKLTMRQRALALISLAHPSQREILKEDAKRYGII